MVQVLQTPTFKKAVKKLHKQDKSILNDVVRKVMTDPTIGESKVGDLAGVLVYKFPMNRQQMLLAYRFNDNPLVIELLALGSHENFYRDVKRSQ